ncbi:MAG: hypothetical protein CMH56_12645 [Myxococcales bacterium]|nr:hypothetical protein [Myxococcales bacterium]|tara:strand:+ start:910 stop:1398 length:489 start_codon:yes stop_codon:yes gene_type:complete
MKIEKAIEIAEELQALMHSEAEKTQEGILHIRQLDLEAIQARAVAREAFNETAGQLEEDLMTAMESAGQEAQLAQTTLDALKVAYPAHGPVLAEKVRGIQSQASRIKQLDAFTQVLMKKALVFAQSYMDCLNPPSVVYDKKGNMRQKASAPMRSVVNVSRRA